MGTYQHQPVNDEKSFDLNYFSGEIAEVRGEYLSEIVEEPVVAPEYCEPEGLGKCVFSEVVDKKSSTRAPKSDSLERYLSEVSKCVILDEETVLEKFEILRKKVDNEGKSPKEIEAEKAEKKQAMECLFESVLRLVPSRTSKYEHLGLSKHELIAYGNHGIFKAIKKFEPDKDVKFSTYAAWWIDEAMSAASYDYASDIRIPRHVRKAMHTVTKAMRELENELHRDPSIPEIIKRIEKIRQGKGSEKKPVSEAKASKDVDLSKEDVVKNLCRLIIQDKIQSLDSQILTNRGTDKSPLFLADTIESDQTDPVIEATRADLKSLLDRHIAKLNSNQQYIIRRRFELANGKDHAYRIMTTTEIGAELELSPKRISAIEREATAALKKSLEREGHDLRMLLGD